MCGHMTWKPPTDRFTVDKPRSDNFAPTGGWGKEGIVSPWTIGAIQQAPQASAQPTLEAYQTDEALKKRYGIELAKSSNPFEAACKLFSEEETNKALWISFHWLVDPVVVASRDIYLKTLELNTPPLDRNQLAAKVLALADEKILKNGVYVPTIEAKDRVAALKLYSEIQGFTGKVEIDNSVTNNTHNEMTIKLVKADPIKPVTVIDNTPNIKSEITNEQLPSPINLKLVRAG